MLFQFLEPLLEFLGCDIYVFCLVAIMALILIKF